MKRVKIKWKREKDNYYESVDSYHNQSLQPEWTLHDENMELLVPRKGDPFQDNEHGNVLTKWLSMQEFVPSSLLFALPWPHQRLIAFPVQQWAWIEDLKDELELMVLQIICFYPDERQLSHVSQVKSSQIKSMKVKSQIINIQING